MSEPALAIADLTYSYGGPPALNGVSLTVQPGRFTALLGPNGAGKSTLFALLTRLLAPGQGAISVFGADLARHSADAMRRMGVVFQAPTLDLDLTVAQNLRYAAALHGISRGAAKGPVWAAMERLGITDKADVKARALNGGHRRRAEIARALMHAPELLLLDEATAGLDAPTRRQLVAHIHDLCRDQGVAVLWATHLIDEVAADDDVVVIHRGQMKAAGRLDQLLAQYGVADAQALFDHLTAGPPVASMAAGGQGNV